MNSSHLFWVYLPFVIGAFIFGSLFVLVYLLQQQRKNALHEIHKYARSFQDSAGSDDAAKNSFHIASLFEKYAIKDADWKNQNLPVYTMPYIHQLAETSLRNRLVDAEKSYEELIKCVPIGSRDAVKLKTYIDELKTVLHAHARLATEFSKLKPRTTLEPLLPVTQ